MPACPIADLDVDRDRAAVPPDLQADARARFHIAHHIDEVIFVTDRRPVNLQNHVPGLQPSDGRWRICVHLVDQGSLGPIQPESLGIRDLERCCHLATDVAPRHAPLLDQLKRDPLDQINRNAKRHPGVAAAVRGDGRVDADDFAFEVQQRPTTRTGIDGGVGLQKVFDPNRVAETDLAALAALMMPCVTVWLRPKGLP